MKKLILSFCLMFLSSVAMGATTAPIRVSGFSDSMKGKWLTVFVINSTEGGFSLPGSIIPISTIHGKSEPMRIRGAEVSFPPITFEKAVTNAKGVEVNPNYVIAVVHNEKGVSLKKLPWTSCPEVPRNLPLLNGHCMDVETGPSAENRLFQSAVQLPQGRVAEIVLEMSN